MEITSSNQYCSQSFEEETGDVIGGYSLRIYCHGCDQSRPGQPARDGVGQAYFRQLVTNYKGYRGTSRELFEKKLKDPAKIFLGLMTSEAEQGVEGSQGGLEILDRKEEVEEGGESSLDVNEQNNEEY